MYRLLAFRAAPLFLRPAAVLLEAALLPGENVLVLVLPISMMVLTLSSIPVHLEFFKASESRVDFDGLGRRYMSALLWLSLMSVVIMAPVLSMAPLDMGRTLITIACLVFLLEKFADEASRALEFRKSYFEWFLLQSLRSAWPILAILLAFFGLNYAAVFLLCALATLLFVGIVFLRVQNLPLRIDTSGLSLIAANLAFFVGSFLPACYRQLPRIVVARVYPQQAHVFLATAQLAQSVGLVFNVRFQIPYRKLIARKTKTIQKILQPVMLRMLLPAGSLAVFYLLYFGGGYAAPASDLALALQLAPIMTADSLVFAIVAAHIGYLPWFATRRSVIFYYVQALLAGAVVVGLVLAAAPGPVNLFMLPGITILIGFAWLLLMKARFFRQN